MVVRALLHVFTDKMIKSAAQKTIRTKGTLKRVTVIPVVSFDVQALTTALLYPGKPRHYRRFNGFHETLHIVIIKCYLYHRQVPGADTEIFITGHIPLCKILRTFGKMWKRSSLCSMFDGYSVNTQFKRIQLFRETIIPG